MTHYNPVTASVSPRALEKATRLFNASLSDIFNELIQNARRAGATAIDVHVTRVPGGVAIRFRDNGCGVADPQSLLALGDSTWDQDVMRGEDPAGMGFFCLSNRECTIRSRTRDAASGWSVDLVPDNFIGKAQAIPVSHAMDPGTEILLHHNSEIEAQSTLKRACKWCPLPVFLNGAELPRKNFLQDAIYTRTWNGVRIGVFQRQYSDCAPNINFHGVALNTSLPFVTMALSKEIWEPCVDIVDCPDLKLVLPARKEPVRDRFLETLKDEAERTLYQAIAQTPAHSLTYRDLQKARALGVDLPDAPPRLRPWTPPVANGGALYEATPVTVPENAALVITDLNPPEAQTLQRAVRRSGQDISLFAPCSGYDGYDWYDRLMQIEKTGFYVIRDGIRLEAEPQRIKGSPARVDGIEVDVVARKQGGDACRLLFETDLLLQGEMYGLDDYGDTAIHIALHHGLTTLELTNLLEAAYYEPCEDYDADSAETQYALFGRGGIHYAISLLKSREEADLERLHDAIREEISWLMPQQGRTIIRFEGRTFTVEHHPA